MNTPKAFRIILAYLKKWLRPPRILHITKAGWQFLGLTLIVGFAAINTANNLLYLVFGLMLSSILISGILSELMLRKVAMRRTFPQHIFAGKPVRVTVTLSNRKRYIASFSLLVEDFSEGSPPPYPPYVLKIPARQTMTVNYPLTFTRRGRHRPGKIRLSTRFPFGFFHKSATYVETEEELLVYPALETLHPAAFPAFSGRAGELESFKKGNSPEVYSVREFLPNDSHARVHWKSTAKLAKLMVKEFHDDQRKQLVVLLDVTLPEKPIPATFFQEVERAISLAATYIAHFLKQDFQVQLATPEYRSTFDHGPRHFFGLLRILALLQPTNGHNRQNFTKIRQHLQRTDVMNVLISVNTMLNFTTETQRTQRKI